MDTQEIEFYEQLLKRHQQTTSQSLLNKRAALAKEDPTEEIIELHLEIQEYEKEFKECVEICGMMLTKTKQMEEILSSQRFERRSSAHSSRDTLV